jgi:hypothetical protein
MLPLSGEATYSTMYRISHGTAAHPITHIGTLVVQGLSGDLSFTSPASRESTRIRVPNSTNDDERVFSKDIGSPVMRRGEAPVSTTGHHGETLFNDDVDIGDVGVSRA